MQVARQVSGARTAPMHAPVDGCVLLPDNRRGTTKTSRRPHGPAASRNVHEVVESRKHPGCAQKAPQLMMVTAARPVVSSWRLSACVDVRVTSELAISLCLRLGTGAMVAGGPAAVPTHGENTDQAPTGSAAGMLPHAYGRLWTNASVSRLLTFSMEYATWPGCRVLRI